MRNYYRALPLLLLGTTAALAQTPGSVGIGTSTPDPKAALDIQATGKGLLIPRLDSSSRASISTPPDGLMVFQTDGRKGFWYAVGGQWLYIPDKTKSGDNLGNHTATQPLRYSTNDADKIWLTRDGGANGSKLAHSGGWSLDYYAGPNNGTSNVGQHRFLTGVNGGWQERMRLSADGNLGIGLTAPAQQLHVAGNIAAEGSLGVILAGANRPLITRAWDPFTSGTYQGIGRWGLFIEPNALTLAVPALASKQFQWVTYNANSTVGSTLMTLTQAGDLQLGGGSVSIPPTENYAYSAARTQYHMLAPADFVSADPAAHPATAYYSTAGYPAEVYLGGSGAGTLVAPVHLPQGAVVTNVELQGFDNDGSSTTTMRARLISIRGVDGTTSYTGGVTGYATLGADQNAFQTANATASMTIDNSQYSYFVVAELNSSAAVTLTHVRLTYTVTRVE